MRINLFAIITATVLLGWSAAAQSPNHIETNDIVNLRVIVLDSIPLSNFKGALMPTRDVDPRFALTVRVESCAPAITNFKSGTVLTYAVHSPTRFLSGSAEKGSAHEISMSRRKAESELVN